MAHEIKAVRGNEKMDLEKFKAALKNELIRSYHKYNECRHSQKEEKKLKRDEIATILGTSIAIGGGAGTVAPGMGNIIGIAAGATVGGITVGCMAIDDYRKNKKWHNAINVYDALNQVTGYNKLAIENLFAEIAEKITQERKFVLEKYTNKEIPDISKHLAIHAMAALKAYKKSCADSDTDLDYKALKNTTVEGVKDRRSQKANSKKIAWGPHGFFSMNSIAKASSIATVYPINKHIDHENYTDSSATSSNNETALSLKLTRESSSDTQTTSENDSDILVTSSSCDEIKRPSMS